MSDAVMNSCAFQEFSTRFRKQNKAISSGAQGKYKGKEENWVKNNTR